MSAAATAPPPSAGDIYNDGVSLLAAQLPVEALAAFTRAAELGHVAAHAGAAAVHFEGAVGRDGTIVDGNCVKAFDMCVRAVALSDT